MADTTDAPKMAINTSRLLEKKSHRHLRLSIAPLNVGGKVCHLCSRDGIVGIAGIPSRALVIETGMTATRSAEEIVDWSVREYGRDLAVCTSFQKTGAVILDMAIKADPGVRVFTLDTGRLPEETRDD